VCALCLGRIFVSEPLVFAQFKAGIQGVVTDPSGAVIPGATVTLTNRETGRIQQVVTSAEGFYRFSGLPPGTYQLVVEYSGFKKKVLDTVIVRAEEVHGLDVMLEPGEIAETVTVQAGAEAVSLQTENPDVTPGTAACPPCVAHR
jgi:hypothetical protein